MTPATSAAATSTTSIFVGRGIRQDFEITMSSRTTAAPENTVCPASVRSPIPIPGCGRLGSAGRGSCDRRWGSRTSVDSSRLFPSRTWSVHSSPVQYRNRKRPAGSANHPALLPTTRDTPLPPSPRPSPQPLPDPHDTTLREIGFDGGGHPPLASPTLIRHERNANPTRHLDHRGPAATPGHGRGRGRAAAAVLALAAGLLLSGVPHAAATPIDDKKAQAAAIQAQIEANSHQIEALGERYDGAVLALQQAQAAVADASARIDATRAEVRRMRDLVRERAASVYRSAASGRSLGAFDVSNAQELLTRNKYAEAQSSQDDALLGRLATAEEQLASQKADAEQARGAADAQRQQIANARSHIEAANAQEQQLLSKVQGELAQLVAQEQARRRRRARGHARTLLALGQRTGGRRPRGVPEPAAERPGRGGGDRVRRARSSGSRTSTRRRARTPTTVPDS